jgi:hypothetical protein
VDLQQIAALVVRKCRKHAKLVIHRILKVEALQVHRHPDLHRCPLIITAFLAYFQHRDVLAECSRHECGCGEQNRRAPDWPKKLDLHIISSLFDIDSG